MDSTKVSGWRLRQSRQVVFAIGTAGIQINATQLSRKGHAGKTQRAVGYDDRRSTEMVIDDFMPIKNADRVGFRNTVVHYAEHAVLVTHKNFCAGTSASE